MVLGAVFSFLLLVATVPSGLAVRVWAAEMLLNGLDFLLCVAVVASVIFLLLGIIRFWAFASLRLIRRKKCDKKQGRKSISG